ncbi:hypothetical protein [Myxacorys almedinensis]|uniref:Minor curlin subunit n=1 Tax=Myxacorys almedinensis A TaxID=2690445 RepID=A0A8J7YYK1_9CYAN|nr:hypothetical protein [Myxacorys almedinensis]NDJ16992.1 hypothetical protein [Myxacorys almedinensis A]
MSSVKAIKLSVFGLLSAAFVSTPAFAQNAASVVQTSEQSAAQVGLGNVAIQGSQQTGIITQTGAPFFPVGDINGAVIHQGNAQGVTQVGAGNSAVQGNVTTAEVLQGSTVYPFPYYPAPDINGATVLQSGSQGVLQHGLGNAAVQGNSTDATVIQH